MQLVLHLDEAALSKAAEYKIQWIRTRRKLRAKTAECQQKDVEIDQLMALLAGARDENDWLKDRMANPE